MMTRAPQCVHQKPPLRGRPDDDRTSTMSGGADIVAWLVRRTYERGRWFETVGD